jgi:hypothetical protein
MFSQGKMVNCQGDWPVDPLAMFSQGKMAVYWRIGRLAAPIIWPELRPGLAMGSQPCFLVKNLAFTDYRKGVFATEGEENTESFSVNASPSVVIYCPQAQASLIPLKKRREIEEQRDFLSGISASLLLCVGFFREGQPSTSNRANCAVEGGSGLLFSGQSSSDCSPGG